jgi:molybdopterin molybdotransferase
MTQENPLLDVSEARLRLLSHFSTLEVIEIPLADGVARVLGKSIFAPISLPPFNNSAMDGFAVKSKDTEGAARSRPIELEVIADIPAGKAADIQIQSNQCARIMTGAVIPFGADAVIPVEETDFGIRNAGVEAPEKVQLFQFVQPGENVRYSGEDMQKGEKVMEAGHVLRPQDVGLLSMLGVSKLSVSRKPRVAIFSSGDELIPVEEPLTPGKIHDANIYTLKGLVELSGSEAIDLGIAADEPGEVQAILQKAHESDVDLILSSAGVSVGALDFVRNVIEQEGEIEFWRVNMRPGKPFAFGYYQKTPFIGLPGNPVSAFVGFEVFVRPALLKMQGRREWLRSDIEARVMEDIHSDGRESYLRAVVSKTDGEFIARLTGHQGSGNLHSLVQANALLLIPSGVKSVPSGARLKAWLLDDSV